MGDWGIAQIFAIVLWWGGGGRREVQSFPVKIARVLGFIEFF
jgi:hypothetical protein